MERYAFLLWLSFFALFIGCSNDDLNAGKDKEAEGTQSKSEPSKADLTKQDALDMMARISPGMKFSQIAKIVPLSSENLSLMNEHGGVWADVPISDNYIIQLRFNHPSETVPIKDCVINFSPRLRDRKNNKMIAGDEKPWQGK
jgi:hypothetical protein